MHQVDTITCAAGMAASKAASRGTKATPQRAAVASSAAINSPALIARAAEITASIPDPHSRLTVTPGTLSGKSLR